MNETTSLQLRPTDALSVAEILNQKALIQDAMRSAMQDGQHFGKIPGCGDKPTLLQPGAQTILLLFRMNPDYDIECIDQERGHREYRVKCRLTNSAGVFIGAGVGSCTTMEGKWRFRVAPKTLTDKPVPAGYWDLRKSDPAKAQELLGGRGFSTKKNEAGQWMIAEGSSEKIEHDNPADNYNTCLKMAKKRALVDATLTRTAASDIFTQDIEDIKNNLDAYADENPQPPPAPQSQPSQKPPQPKAQKSDGEVIHNARFEGYKINEGKSKKSGKPYTLFILKYLDENNSPFEVQTFDDRRQDYDVLTGQEVTVRHKAGWKEGVRELVSMEPKGPPAEKDEPPF